MYLSKWLKSNEQTKRAILSPNPFSQAMIISDEQEGGRLENIFRNILSNLKLP